MKYNSRQFITETKKLYDKYHSNFEELKNEYDRLKKQEISIMNDRRLVSKAKQEALAQQKQAISSLLSQIENNHKAYLKETDKIKAKADSVYHDYYKVHASEMDEKEIVTLSSGIYKKHELYELADKYKDNIGMLRLIGSYIKQSYGKDDKEAYSYGSKLEKLEKQNDITNAIDSFNMIALRGLGKGRGTDTTQVTKHGVDIAKGFNDVIDRQYNALLNKVPSVNAEYTLNSPYSYTEENCNSTTEDIKE